MANYDLVINTQFKPFSYQELLAPVLRATQAHQELEDQYGELSAAASVWDRLANEHPNSQAYKTYKSYANDLRNQADLLAKEGLNATSRRNLLDMRTRYGQEIIPIETAYKRQQELAEEQRKMALNPATRMFYERMAHQMSIDDFIKDPMANYGESYSEAQLLNQASQMASNLKNALTHRGGLQSSGLAYQYDRLLQYGFTPSQIQQALTNPSKGNPVLATLIDQVIDASGMKKWATPQQLDRARAIAGQGLYNAIGTTNYEHLTDQAGLSGEGNPSNPDPTGKAINKANIYSNRGMSEEELKYKANKENYSKYFYYDSKNKQWKMTHEGWKKMNTPGTTTYQGADGRLYHTKAQGVKSDFRKFMESIGAPENAQWQPGTLGNLWAKYIQESPEAKTAKYDALQLTEVIFDVPQTPEYQKEFKAKLSRAIGSDRVLKEVDYNPNTNKWEPTGETLSFNDFDTDEYSLVSQNPSEIGTTLMIRKKGEKAKRYLAVPGINTRAEGARDEAAKRMVEIQRYLEHGNLSLEQRSKLEDEYRRLDQEVVDYQAQLGLVNDTKTQAFDPKYVQ